MDPQTNIAPSSINPETTGATDTFSEQVAAEKSVSEENFNQSQLATSQHNRRIIYYVIWAVLLLLLLSAVAGGSYILWRNRQGLAENLGIGNLFNPTRLDIRGPQATIDVGGGDGLLTVNGSQLITGDLTVNGDTNISGNLTAASFIGDGSGLTGVSADLPPFVAFTNSNNQLFFGNNQLFRNSSDSTTALSVQQSSGNPVFNVDTVNNKGKFFNGLEVGNIANIQGSIFNDPFFGIGSLIYKNLAVASEITNNLPGVTYTASGNEFLINPQNDPSANLFAANYGAAKIAETNSYAFETVAGNLNSLIHAGSGKVHQAVGQISIVGSEGSGDIVLAANSVNTTTLSSSGDIFFSGGVLTLNPSILPGSTGKIATSAGLVAGNCFAFKALNFINGYDPTCVGVDPYDYPALALQIDQQIGLLVLQQDASAFSNINTVSQGTSSINYFEGRVGIGTCAPTALAIFCGGADSINSTLTVNGTADISGNTSIGAISATNRLSVVDTTPGDDTPANFTGANGTCTVDTLGGGWSCVSDEKLKENILQINSASDIIDQLRGVTFAWKSDEEKNQVSGFIAQEVQKVLPGLVSTLEDGTLSLNKDGMLPYLVEAVKESNGKIGTINSQLTDQGLRLDNLSEEFAKLAERFTVFENRVDILETKVINQEQRIKQLEEKVNTSAPAPASP